jgi:DNA polymerase kappa
MTYLYKNRQMSENSRHENYAHLFVFSGTNKAGMDGCDKENQARVIYEMSKNSAYFKQAEKQDKITDSKVESIKTLLATVTELKESSLKEESLRKAFEIEKNRHFGRICCVLDMDMFFAAVEIRDRPELKDLPVAVGGDMMISTANYVARKFGVRAAMPGFIARKLCPQLVFVDCNFNKYETVSTQIREIIAEYDPYYRSHSLDEVFFDLTDAAIRRLLAEESGRTEIKNDRCTSQMLPTEDLKSEKKRSHGALDTSNYDIRTLRGHAFNILHEIRARITTTTGGLTCSAGIANNFFLAKICADKNKPDGQFEIAPHREAVMEFLEQLPTRKIGGIGKVTEKILEKLGMRTVGDMRRNMHRILFAFTPKTAEFLARTSLGIGQEEGHKDGGIEGSVYVEEDIGRKSLGCERTFPNMRAPAAMFAKLEDLSQSVAADMVEKGLWARTVTLKLKTSQFALFTRSASSGQGKYFQSADAISSLARPLLERMLPVEIRLMGVSVSHFKSNGSSSSTSDRNKISRFFTSTSSSSSSSSSSTSSSSTSTPSNTLVSSKVTDYDDEACDSTEEYDRIGEALRDSDRSAETIAMGQQSESGDGDLECPVCGIVRRSTLSEMNQHIDECLTSQYLHSEGALVVT